MRREVEGGCTLQVTILPLPRVSQNGVRGRSAAALVPSKPKCCGDLRAFLGIGQKRREGGRRSKENSLGKGEGTVVGPGLAEAGGSESAELKAEEV